MKPSILEVRRLEALEALAEQIKAITVRLDDIEVKLDKALALKANPTPKADAKEK